MRTNALANYYRRKEMTEHKHTFSLVKEPGGRAKMVCECKPKVKVTEFSAELLFVIEDEGNDER